MRAAVAARMHCRLFHGQGPRERAPGSGKAGGWTWNHPLPRPGSAKRDKATRHTVTKGDTLYSIAWRYGHDYKALAAWNRIESPFTIYPGQVISLVPARKSQTLRPAPAAKKQSRKPGRTADTTAATSSPNKRAAPAPAAPELAAAGCAYPLAMACTRQVAEGIDADRKKRNKHWWADRPENWSQRATGRVVYSGSGLRGYGNLVIIKHRRDLLERLCAQPRAGSQGRRMQSKPGNRYRRWV